MGVPFEGTLARDDLDVYKTRALGEIKGNGLDKAIVRVGRKVLIDESKFFEWLAAQNAQGAE